MNLPLRAFFQGYDWSEQSELLRPVHRKRMIEIFLQIMINV